MIKTVTPVNIPQNEWVDTRDAIINRLIKLGKENKKLVLLDADVSKSTRSRKFGEKYPDRFWNVGIAEMHMASMAAALSADGMKPCICSFATFLSMRALEPIRTQIVYPHLPVVMMGGYAGLSAMQHGPTHQCIVDMSIMSAMPGITLLNPSDSVSAADLAEEALMLDKPVYLRVGYNKQRAIYEQGTVKAGDCYMLTSGKDILVLSTGLSTVHALDAAETLERDGLSICVTDIPTIKPFPEKDIADLAAYFKTVITVEEHVESGGLYAHTCIALNKQGIRTNVIGLNLGDSFAESAPYIDLLSKFGLDECGVVNAARKARMNLIL